MRLVVVSDTHGLHNRIQELPDGDVLIHAGDFMNSGYDPEDIRSFNRWLEKQPFEHRVVCGGNHDRYFQNSPHQARALLTNAIYLENDGVTIDNVFLWGYRHHGTLPGGCNRALDTGCPGQRRTDRSDSRAVARRYLRCDLRSVGRRPGVWLG